MRNRGMPYYWYLEFILKYRVFFLAIILGVVAYSATTIKEGFVYSDRSLWLQGSQEYDKLLTLKYPSLCVEKIVVDISESGWNPETVKDLRNLQDELKWHSYVTGVNSFFEQKSVINNEINSEQSMVEFITLLDSTDEFIFHAIQDDPEKYRSFFEDDKVIFYVLSSKEMAFDDVKCELPFEVFDSEENRHVIDIMLFTILIIILIISFTIAFKSIIPSILGIVFIASTTIVTVTVYQLISVVQVTHISIVLLAIVISVMDFIYIYYKWHALQKQQTRTKEQLLYHVMAKTVIPIFSTTFISMVGIGSLMLVDSQILYSMGLNVVLSSASGFILSFTLLPIMLSFFMQKDPEILTKNSARYFAEIETHYHKFALNLFLVMSVMVFLYSIVIYVLKPLNVVTYEENNQIHIALSEKGLTADNLLELQNIQSLLKGTFPEIKEFSSAHVEIEKLYHQEHPDTAFKLHEIDIDSYQFMFDLYNITPTITVNDHLTLTIYLGDSDNKMEILSFIRDEGILIQDQASLIDMAKMDSINTLFYVVFFVMALIMMVTYKLTKTLEFSVIALVVNAIPLAWFFSVVMAFDIPLSIDMLVAMIITVAVSSDASLHFIFYYYDNRHKPRTPALALERSFLYIGTPLAMGNIILMLTFIALIFIPDSTISNIGLYSSLLIALSLLMDLFILPVLFLNQVRNNKSISDYYHGR